MSPQRRRPDGGAAGAQATAWPAPERDLSALPLPDVEAMTAEESLLWAYEQFGDKLCLTCSWQKQSSVLVHMVSELGLPVPVVELDTGLFFAETYATRERLVERYGLDLIRPPVISIAEQHRREGPNLWERDADRCCHVRKVEPLERVLHDYDSWISGIRREQSLTRKDSPARRVERPLRGLEDPSARRLGLEARRRLHPCQRDPVQPAARRGLSVDRLHSLHPPRESRAGRAGRALGRLRQDRVRYPRPFRGAERLESR